MEAKIEGAIDNLQTAQAPHGYLARLHLGGEPDNPIVSVPRASKA